MASNLVMYKRSNHIDLRYHLVKDFANKGTNKLEYINTAHHIADSMTKSLQKLKHNSFTNMLLQDQEERKLEDQQPHASSNHAIGGCAVSM